MPRINLLPWREELRQRRQKKFLVLVGTAAALAAGVVLLVHLQFNAMIDHQNKRNQFLNDHISGLDRKIKEIKDLDKQKQDLIARMEVIQQLQASRPEIVHVFDEMVRTLPGGVYFQRVTQRGRAFTINGVAQSNARVSSLMRNFDASDWLKSPALVEITAGKETSSNLRLSNFGMRVNQTDPVKTSDEGS